VSEALGANGLLTVWGSGGVGKTTLAIEAAHCLFPRPYRGGIIWESADARPDFTLVTLLDKILTDLGREEARTLAPDAKSDLAVHLLTEAMPCLLCLDNFETIAPAEQEAFIGFVGRVCCPVLVTSRESARFGQNIRVGPMRPDEAQQFLSYLVQQSPKRKRLATVDRDRLAREAEYNPMLMRWMIRQLAHEMPPEDVYADLDRGEGDAQRVFGRSFDLLGDDGQAALLALALFVPTASREALAAVCGFEDGKDRVNEAIRRLAAFDLLDTAVEGDRLGIVALTRRLTRARLAEDERTGVLVGRFVLHFVKYVLDYPEATKEDLDALEDERQNLLATLDYAYAAEDWESVIRLADEICAPVTGLLGVRGYWDEAIKWAERAAEAATQANLPAVAAALSGNVGAIHNQRGDYAEAREAYQKALLFFQQDGDQRNIAVVLHQLGVVAHLQSDHQEAKNFYNQSLQTFRDLGARSEQAAVLHQLGMVAQDEGDYREAKDLYDQSLETARNLGDQAGIAKSLHNLGVIAYFQGDYQEARKLYDQSLKIKRNLRDQAGIASSLHQLGIIAQEQGDYQEARNLYHQSLEIKRILGDQRGIAASLHQLGRLAEESGQVEKAAQLYREALSILERLGSPEAEKVRRALARVTGEQPKE